MATLINLQVGTLGQDTGYQWTVQSDDFASGQATYRTNTNREELYLWSDAQQNWSQCRGNDSYRLSSDPTTAKQQVVARLQSHPID